MNSAAAVASMAAAAAGWGGQGGRGQRRDPERPPGSPARTHRQGELGRQLTARGSRAGRAASGRKRAEAPPCPAPLEPEEGPGGLRGRVPPAGSRSCPLLRAGGARPGLTGSAWSARSLATRGYVLYPLYVQTQQLWDPPRHQVPPPPSPPPCLEGTLAPSVCSPHPGAAGEGVGRRLAAAPCKVPRLQGPWQGRSELGTAPPAPPRAAGDKGPWEPSGLAGAAPPRTFQNKRSETFHHWNGPKRCLFRIVCTHIKKKKKKRKGFALAGLGGCPELDSRPSPPRKDPRLRIQGRKRRHLKLPGFPEGGIGKDLETQGGGHAVCAPAARTGALGR